jgi:hypothetical protein
MSQAIAADICIDKDVSDLDDYVTSMRSSLPPISKDQESLYQTVMAKREVGALSGDQRFALWRIWYFSERTRLAFATASRAGNIKSKISYISDAAYASAALAANIENQVGLLDGPNPTREGLLLYGSARLVLSTATVGLSKALRCYAQQMPG